MKRRSFISGLVKACVAASVAANLVREETLLPVQRATFDPVAYVGEYRWIHYPNHDGATGAFRHQLNQQP